MPGPEIALFANKGSAQLAEIAAAVEGAGGVPVMFDIQLGGESRPPVAIGQKTLMWGGVDFSNIRAIHIRCTAPNTFPALPPVLNAAVFAEMRASFLREQEYQAAVYSFFETFASRGGLLINPLTSAYIDHDSKSQFYEKLRSHGFDVPRGITTNDFDSAVSFIGQTGGAVVKPACGIGSTRVVSSLSPEDVASLRLCPVLLQERIVGDTIRVHIVGDTVVLSLRIASNGSVDSRTNTAGFEYFRLPEAEAQKIVSANRLLGLHYAAWDIIAAEDGRYVYLDCNPGPYVMWIGPKFRAAVFKQLALYMVAYAETGCVGEAAARIRPCTQRAA